MEHFVELISAIVWPATLIWFFHYFKPEFKSLLSKIHKIKYKEFEAGFDGEVSEVNKQVKKRGEKVVAKKIVEIPKKKEELNFRDQLYRIADISPQASIAESWRYLEDKVNQFGPLYNLETKGHASETKILEKLKNEQKIDADFFKFYLTLRELRNRAIHRKDFLLSQESAEEYIDSILELSEELGIIFEESI